MKWLCSMEEQRSKTSIITDNQQGELVALCPRWPRGPRLGSVNKITDLARNYKELRHLKEAAKYLCTVTDTRTELFGKEHMFTVASKARLALVYAATGRLEKGAELMDQVIKARKAKQELEQHKVPDNMTCLASIYYGLGRLREAELLMIEVAEMAKSEQSGRPLCPKMCGIPDIDTR